MSNRSEEFGLKLNNLIYRNHVNISRMSYELGIPYSTMRSYISGKNMPNKSRLYKIAEYFNCDPDWLHEYSGDYEEGWKQHQVYDNYELNTNGTIRNICTGRVLKTNLDNKGYEIVSLRNNNKPHTERVHKLMSDTFIGNIPNDIDIYHENSNRSDNRLSNLKYCSKSETSKRGFNNGNRRRPDSIPVRIEKINNPSVTKTFESIKECAEYLQVSVSAVSKCANDVTTSCKGHNIYLI